jgi:signal transduction histidine kinase
MMVLTIIASVLIAGMSIYQFQEQAKDYHENRLLRKEQAIKENISYVISKTDYEVTTENLDLIFKNDIYGISDIHEMPIFLYDLDGKLKKSSKALFKTDSLHNRMPSSIINHLRESDDGRYVEQFELNGQSYRSSYSYLLDRQFKNIAILHLPYIENDDFMKYELQEFLRRLGVIYALMFLISLVLGYFLARYITRSIRSISDNLKELDISKRNRKLEIDDKGTEEINTLVASYNKMVEELEESAVKLATTEREQAWREMAKQVAHEIKNPLTPMRLTVQSFERRFDPAQVDSKEKLKEFSNTLIEQIDVMSHIASAFSTYATMPAQQSEETDVCMVTQLALDIFNESNIHYKEDVTSLKVVFDRTQLIRVVTNLVKNALQATVPDRENKIIVSIQHDENRVYLIVSDQGSGVHPDHEKMIFEPKFTTKNSGMGLGLAMVKQIVENFKGNIDMKTIYGAGTTFTVTLPKANKRK